MTAEPSNLQLQADRDMLLAEVRRWSEVAARNKARAEAAEETIQLDRRTWQTRLADLTHRVERAARLFDSWDSPECAETARLVLDPGKERTHSAFVYDDILEVLDGTRTDFE